MHSFYFKTTFLNMMSKTLSTPATIAPKIMAKTNTAIVRRQVSTREGHVTRRTSRQELTKYFGTSQRKIFKMNRPIRAKNFTTGLRVNLVFLSVLPAFEKVLRTRFGFSLSSLLALAVSACSRIVGAFRTLGFLKLRFLASATFSSN
jgi:hypothetical protein